MAKFISLKKNDDIVSVIKKNQKIYLKDISIYYQKNNLDVLRIAISVSKKHFKLAVDRNKVKRLIKAWFIAIEKNYIGYDIVVIAKPSFNDGSFIVKYKELQKKLQHILS